MFTIQPQLVLFAAHSAGAGSLTHTPFSQADPSWQAPQSSTPPHPSEITPHPLVWQDSWVHVRHACAILSQTSGAGHEPQSRDAPQPSVMVPQATPAAAQSRVGQALHRWVARSHCSPAGHAPHSICVPQSSVTGPHFAPNCAHVWRSTVASGPFGSSATAASGDLPTRASPGGPPSNEYREGSPVPGAVPQPTHRNMSAPAPDARRRTEPDPRACPNGPEEQARTTRGALRPFMPDTPSL